jgi:hypothetical protein
MLIVTMINDKGDCTPFEHEGVTITNITKDETGRFDIIDPLHYYNIDKLISFRTDK